MRIIDYENKRLTFYCEQCNIYGEYDLQSILSDNCAVDVEVFCDNCGASGIVYILICYDQSLATILQAQLNNLKEKRSNDANH